MFINDPALTRVRSATCLKAFVPVIPREVEYLLEFRDVMYPGWVYAFVPRKQWLMPLGRILVKPKNYLELGPMDIHRDWLFSSVMMAR